ncbi:hypothetical protein DVR12_13545 [Chitinophaga silvatica]|uniref:Uncharacterized protein n=1 Tax=Chitinophaga silvatica TaxID=2282649 RepID=A0A3E1YAW8_9BACT|nr:hypothetical protein [Chitinophaga silvatica]RFS22807.1 hypothetical protein DVR12_13545 [Chitinophaga silvatica]
MYKFYYLICLLGLACQQPASSPEVADKPTTSKSSKEKTISFNKLSADENADSAEFEANGIRVTITNTLPMQAINISQKNKRLINYLHAIDSPTTSIPVPTLITSNKDTVVVITYQEQRYSFMIKNNTATLSKER